MTEFAYLSSAHDSGRSIEKSLSLLFELLGHVELFSVVLKSLLLLFVRVDV